MTTSGTRKVLLTWSGPLLPFWVSSSVMTIIVLSFQAAFPMMSSTICFVTESFAGMVVEQLDVGVVGQSVRAEEAHVVVGDGLVGVVLAAAGEVVEVELLGDARVGSVDRQGLDGV